MTLRSHMKSSSNSSADLYLEAISLLDTMCSSFISVLYSLSSASRLFSSFCALAASRAARSSARFCCRACDSYASFSAAKSGLATSRRVFSSRLTMSLTFLSTLTRFTAFSLWNPTCPISMPVVFLRLAQGVYTIHTLFILQPWIEFCFTSCAQSSSVSSGMSSMVAPSGSRRYTCALDRSSTWNQRSQGSPYLMRSSFSYLSRPMYMR
mmetsp:Transcript_23047/g.58908  ORF Transcript_23047/g.58908 Transcript_23047/m.58908 type:complete len:209 (-) Transcript_23047:110-736(-)